MWLDFQVWLDPTFESENFKDLKHCLWALLSALALSLVAQTLMRLSAWWETWVRSLSQEDALEKEMPTHSSTLAWKISWMEESGGLQSMGPQRVGHDWATSRSFFHSQAHIPSLDSPNISRSVFKWKILVFLNLTTSGDSPKKQKQKESHKEKVQFKIPEQIQVFLR